MNEVVKALLIAGLAAALFVACAIFSSAYAHFHDHDKWAQVSPEMRLWMQNQRIPNQPQFSCCSAADADDELEEEVVEGHYRIRGKMTKGEWMDVPDEVVIKQPNRYGRPVVWWRSDVDKTGAQHLFPRCYAPGALY